MLFMLNSKKIVNFTKHPAVITTLQGGREKPRRTKVRLILLTAINCKLKTLNAIVTQRSEAKVCGVKW